MHILNSLFLNSEWLIKMLEKSSQTPHGRLLSLFDILEDWLDAPNVAPTIREQIAGQFTSPKPAKILQDYLTLEAAKAGAAMPEMLASQLYFMAICAINEHLQPQGLSPHNIPAKAGYSCVKANYHKGFSHAKSAANALILAQTRKEFYIAKSSAYAMAASFLGVLVIAGSAFMFNLKQTQKAEQFTELQSATLSTLVSTAPTLAISEMTASPDQTVAIMAQLELMRHGNCQLIEAIQLPDSQKGIYLNMVVNGQVSTDPHDQKIAMELIKKTRCSYTPMLMVNSKS